MQQRGIFLSYHRYSFVEFVFTFTCLILNPSSALVLIHFTHPPFTFCYQFNGFVEVYKWSLLSAREKEIEMQYVRLGKYKVQWSSES